MELNGTNGEKYKFEKSKTHWCKLFKPKFKHEGDEIDSVKNTIKDNTDTMIMIKIAYN